MPAPIDPKLKAQIRRAYVNSKLTFGELAKQFDVSDRSIQNWAKAENWDAERKAENVIEFARQPKQERPPVRTRVNSDDALAIADLIISDLQGEMARGDVTAKDKASVANALKAWVEYRRKIHPPTVAELVELAIKLNVGPDEFLTELRNAWKRKAV
jgi:transposase-like protein